MTADAWARTQERMVDEQLGLAMFEQDKDPERHAEWLPNRYEVVIDTNEGSSYVYGSHAYRSHAEAERRRINRPGYFAPGTVRRVWVREVVE